MQEKTGLYGTIHLLLISNNTKASKQSLQSHKTALGGLKMTSEAAVTRPIIFNIKKYPYISKAGSHSIYGMAGHCKTYKQIPLSFISNKFQAINVFASFLISAQHDLSKVNVTKMHACKQISLCFISIDTCSLHIIYNIYYT